MDAYSRVQLSTPKNSGAFDIRGWIRDSFDHDQGRLFWVFAAIHIFLWTVLPTLVSGNAPLDVIEGYAWGHEWQWGTYKHPPLQAWVLEFFAIITGRAPWAHYLVSQLCVAGAMWAVWKTGERIAGPRVGLLGALMLESIVYYNFTSPEFNPNLLQLPLWALTGMFFHRAIKDNRLADWMMAGLWSAAGMYSKYSTIALIAALMILMVAHPEGRRRWTSPGPYIAIATLLLLFLPHLVWLSQHNYMPFTYVKERLASQVPVGFFRKWVALPFFFLVGQAVTLSSFAMLYLFSFWRNIDRRAVKTPSFDRAFLLTMCVGPALLALALCLSRGCQIHDMWATPFWNFVPLGILVFFPPMLTASALRRLAYGGLGLAALAIVCYNGGILLYPYVTHKTQRVNFPGAAVAERIEAGWHAQSNEPLRYVIGDIWPAGNLAFYGSDRPHVVIKDNFEISPWVAADDVKKNGGVFVWCIQYCIGRGSTEAMPGFVRDYPVDKVAIQEPILLPRLTGAKLPPVHIGWAILSPMTGTTR